MVIDLQKTGYDFSNASRDLNEEELEAENKATKFPSSENPRIKPIIGTLAYTFRNLTKNLAERNETIIGFLDQYLLESSNKDIEKLVTTWKACDSYSKKRIDIFDILCRRFGIKYKKFWAAVQEGMFDYNDFLTRTALNAAKPELIANIEKFSKDKHNFKDRELLAKATGVIDEKPLIEVNDNSRTVNNNNIFPNFMETMRTSNQIFKEERKELSEGKMDYVDAQIINEEEKVLIFNEEEN